MRGEVLLLKMVLVRTVSSQQGQSRGLESREED
jgi:hypothetical protein